MIHNPHTTLNVLNNEISTLCVEVLLFPYPRFHLVFDLEDLPLFSSPVVTVGKVHVHNSGGAPHPELRLMGVLLCEGEDCFIWSKPSLRVSPVLDFSHASIVVGECNVQE